MYFIPCTVCFEYKLYNSKTVKARLKIILFIYTIIERFVVEMKKIILIYTNTSLMSSRKLSLALIK